MRDSVIELALDEPALSPRERLRFTDSQSYFVSEAPTSPNLREPRSPIRPPLRNRKFVDSPLEGGGFEPSVPLKGQKW